MSSFYVAQKYINGKPENVWSVEREPPLYSFLPPMIFYSYEEAVKRCDELSKPKPIVEYRRVYPE